jgi:Domain of unknown function (DUF4349)
MNTAAHPFAPEEIMAFLDGEPNPSFSASIAAHVDSCNECQQLFATLRSTSDSVATWRVEPGDFKSRDGWLESALSEANAKPNAKIQSQLQRLQLMILRPLPLAVALLLCLSVIGLQLFRRSGSSESIFGYMAKSQVPVRPQPPSPSNRTDSEYGFSTYTADQGHAADLYLAENANGPSATGSLGKLEERATKERKSVVVSQPMIARSAMLSIIAKDFTAARASLESIVSRHNGYSAQLTFNNEQNSARSLQASLRVPAGQLQAALADLKALGRVETESQNGEEVTQQHADLVARLKNSRETEQRLQDVLRTRTGKMSDILEVEQEIARVRGEIEQMEAEQKALEHRVNFSTIELKITEEYKAQLSSPAPSVSTQLHNAAVNGLRSALESLLAIVLFLAEAGPTLLLWLMVLFLPAFWLWRRFRRALHPAISQ